MMDVLRPPYIKTAISIKKFCEKFGVPEFSVIKSLANQELASVTKFTNLNILMLIAPSCFQRWLAERELANNFAILESLDESVKESMKKSIRAKRELVFDSELVVEDWYSAKVTRALKKFRRVEINYSFGREPFVRSGTYYVLTQRMSLSTSDILIDLETGAEIFGKKVRFDIVEKRITIFGRSFDLKDHVDLFELLFEFSRRYGPSKKAFDVSELKIKLPGTYSTSGLPRYFQRKLKKDGLELYDLILKPVGKNRFQILPPE
jgi:hypothetical protein